VTNRAAPNEMYAANDAVRHDFCTPYLAHRKASDSFDFDRTVKQICFSHGFARASSLLRARGVILEHKSLPPSDRKFNSIRARARSDRYISCRRGALDSNLT